jgi:hypothetical protein
MRFGLGFYTDHDNWQIDFDWTWLNITEYQNANASAGGATLIPLWGTGIDATSAGVRSSATWKASYNMIDLDIGKPYHVSRFVIVNPHFGIRGGWIDQHYSVSYAGTTGPRTIHHGDHNDFWGVGARVGIDTDWIVGKGWNLFANFSGSMVAGKFEISQELVGPTGTVFNLENDFYQNSPNVEMAIGLAWSQFFSKSKYRVSLKAAYEFIEWWDQLYMRKFFNSSTGTHFAASDTVARGNLSMNGFSLRLQLDI